MAAASMLYADYLGLGTIGFGTILEATPWNFSPRRGPINSKGPFAAAGLADFSPIRGLTEFGTAMVIHHKADKEAELSLASVADPGTEKLFRKRLLIETARHLNGADRPEFPTYNLPTQKVPFGSSFAVDFLALYFIRLYGIQAVSAWIEGLEELDLDWVKEHSLAFYTRYNTNFVSEIPWAIRGEFLDGYHSCGILPYSELDWEEFAMVGSFLSQYHQVPGRRI